MKNSGLKRLSSLTGALSAVLMISGALMFGVFDYLPSADRLQVIFGENPVRVSSAGYIYTLSAFFLIWFAGNLYHVLHKREGKADQFAITAFGGGLGSGIALLAGCSTIIAAGARAGVPDRISSAEAITFYDFYSHILGQMFAITLAVFIGSSGIVFMRTGLFPAWVGWLSVIIAFGLLTPVGYMVITLSFLWLLCISVWLYIRGDANVDNESIPHMST